MFCTNYSGNIQTFFFCFYHNFYHTGLCIFLFVCACVCLFVCLFFLIYNSITQVNAFVNFFLPFLETKKTFSLVTSLHIYSVQNCKLKVSFKFTMIKFLTLLKSALQLHYIAFKTAPWCIIQGSSE